MDVAQLGNDILLGRTRVRHSGTRPLTPTSNDPRQYGDGRGEVIPSFDGTDFRQHERRILLFCVHINTSGHQREGLVNFWSDWKGRALASREGIQDLETPNVVENVLEDTH